MSLFLYLLRKNFQSLTLKPAFVVTVVTTLGLAFTGLMLISTIMYTVFFKTLPYPEADQLMVVNHQLIDAQQQVDGNAFIYPNLEYLYLQQTELLDSSMLYADADVMVSHAEQPMVEINFVTPEWFKLFPAITVLGRVIESTEQRNSYQPVVILSYDVWQKYYSGNREIIGRSLVLSNRSYEIIGVLSKYYNPPKLFGVEDNVGLYIPWDFNTVSPSNRQAWGNDDGGLMMIGKLPQSQSIEYTNQSLTRLINGNWQQQISDTNFFKGWSINMSVTPLKEVIIGPAEQSIVLLFIGVSGLVVIAVINILNLFMAHVATQSHQLAIASALGAKKRHLFMDVFALSVSLMMLATIIAIIASLLLMPILNNMLVGYLPRVSELDIDINVFVLIITIALFIAFTISCVAIKVINSQKLQQHLQQSGKGKGIQVSGTTRKMMTSAQVAVASLLLFVNFSLIIDGVALLNKPLGYQPENHNFAVLVLPESNQEQKVEIMNEVLQAVQDLPMVNAVGQGLRPSSFYTSGMVSEATNKSHSFLNKDVDHKYFEMLGYQFIAGDNFTEQDYDDGKRLAVVNQSLAELLKQDRPIIGYSFTNGVRIIGVVQDILVPGQRESKPRMYTLTPPSRNMLIIQTLSGQSLSRDVLVHTLKEVNEKIALFSYESLVNNRDQRMLLSKVTVGSAIAITALTLFLAMIGLYGVFNMTSTMRRGELAARMAIGAKRHHIITLMLLAHAKSAIWGVICACTLGVTYYVISSELPPFIANQFWLACVLMTMLIVSLVLVIATLIPLQTVLLKPINRSLRV